MYCRDALGRGEYCLAGKCPLLVLIVSIYGHPALLRAGGI